MNDDAMDTGRFDEASRLKNIGNDLLLEHDYNKAAEKYTEALNALNGSIDSEDADDNEKSVINDNAETCKLRAILFSNRAQAYIKTEAYGLAVQDATNAIKADKTYPKGYYRRGTAEFALNKPKAARKDFRMVCKLRPKDRDARAKFNECEKACREAAFALAIESEETVPLSSTIDLSTISIESSYDGPHPCGATAVALDNFEEEKTMFLPGMLPREFVMKCIERFKAQKLFHKRYVAQLLVSCKRYFEELPSLLRVDVPDLAPEGIEGNNPAEEPRITVCGDTHGQFYDVMNIFKLNGYPSASNPYIFNGDFVDRGSFSVEVILTFLLLKISCPDGIYLLRGNHETKNMNKIYGFEGEVKAKYDQTIFDLFLEVFCQIPLAAVVGGKVFVTHGGIPTTPGVTLKDIENISRGCEPSDTGLMSDLLWSDPQSFPGKSPSKRGIGFSFGPDITSAFLEHNDLSLLIRSHEVKEEGYLVEHGGKCITVFSAPNYCDQMGNKGAFIHLRKDLEARFTKFTSVEHPDVKPMAYAAGMGGLYSP